MTLDGPRDVRSAEPGVDLQVQVDVQPVLDPVDDGRAALPPVGLEPVDLGFEGRGGLDSVPQEVEPLVGGLDLELDAVDDRDAVPNDDRAIERRLEPIMVGHPDDRDAAPPGRVRNGR